MGRLAKNPPAANPVATGFVVPSSPSAFRPLDPKVGSSRYNLNTDKLEIWNGIEWRTIASEGTVRLNKDTFIGDGSSLIFGPMSYSKQAGDEVSVVVFVGNVHQNPGIAYNFNGSNTIEFASPPPAGHTVVLVHNLNSTVAE